MPASNAAPFAKLADADLDLLVVGGGITGACVALEAVRRGLRTALVDRGDFGGGATANCLRIVHGGLRYLQHLDLRRSRESSVERSMWLRSAPHLVEPLPVVLPTRRGTFPPRWMLGAALAVNEALSADRNRGLDPARRLPQARLLSRRECTTLVPHLDHPDVTGGVLFHDAIMYSPDRLTLEVILAAREVGAITANYLAFVAPRTEGGRVKGAALRDALTGEEVEVRTRWIVNASGAQAAGVARQLSGARDAEPQAWSWALNLVTRHAHTEPAFTVAGGAADPDRVVRAGARQLFVVPWRGQRLFGTAHFPFSGDPAGATLPDELVARFTEELRNASPAIQLTEGDVQHVQWGLLPVTGRGDLDQVRLLKHHRILDHGADGVAGAFSVVSVKFTTARRLALDVLARITRRTATNDATPDLGLLSKPPSGIAATIAESQSRFAQLLPADVIEHLVRAYGRSHEQLVALCREVPGASQRLSPESPVIAAQFIHAVRHEQARTADDLLWRRTELGQRGLITPAARAAAEQSLSQYASA